MKRKCMQLTCIENNRNVTPEADGEFLYCLQSGLLLALKEQRVLDEIQCRLAIQRLGEQTHQNKTKGSSAR